MKVAVFILIGLLFLSCKSDDDNSITTHELIGTWNLVKFQPGFAPIDFYTDEIQWTFNSDNTVNVIIEEGVDINLSLPLNSTGEYTYVINEDEVLVDTHLLKFEINGNELILEGLNGAAADGKRLTFNKVE